MGGEEESARAAGGIGDRSAGRRADALHHGADQRPGREVLARAGLDVLGVPFQQPLVDVALHIRAQHHPVGAVHHGDQAIELRRVGDLVLRFGEDLPEHAPLLAKRAQQIYVVRIEVSPAAARQAPPAAAFGDADVAVVRRLRVFVGHFEEYQVGELFEI